MLDILGIRTEEFALPIKEFVGTVLFAEYPTTMVFVDYEGNPIIKEWVDCTDDGNTDRYFYYKTTKVLLKQFLKAHLSHLDLIINTSDGQLYFQDITNQKEEKNFVISSNHLPNQYKPASSFYLEEDDGVDIDHIYSFFELDNIASVIPISETVKEISYSRKSEILNLRLLNGLGVGFGTVDTDILGRTLTKFDMLYRDVALDFFLKTNRGAVSLKAKRRTELSSRTGTEVVATKAASYSVLIRSKDNQYGMYKETSPVEMIARKIFDLIAHSDQMDLLQTEYVTHSDHTIKAYKEFLTGIYEMQLNVELYWFNSATTNEYQEELNYHRADRILNNIKNLNVEAESSFTKEGKFRAVNCNTGHFIFVSTDGEDFNGHFDKTIKGDSERITFVALYSVQMTSKIVKQPEKANARVITTVTKFREAEPDKTHVSAIY